MYKKKIHLLILAINFICLIVILQVDIGIISLYNSGLQLTRIENINSLVSNLSQGIIISTFFYFLLVYLPERFKQKSLRKIIQKRLTTIVDELQKSILYLTNKHSLNINISRLKKSDFSSITELSNIPMNFEYSVLNNQGQFISFSTGDCKELDHFSREKELIKKKVNEILNHPNITYEDETLIELLCRLKDCWFYQGIESFIDMRFPNSKKVVIDFDKGVYEYFKIYYDLIKFSKPHKMEVKKE
jgi:hypothetical protein